MFFAFGYAKKDKANLDVQELTALRLLAKEFLGYDEAKIAILIESGALLEILC